MIGSNAAAMRNTLKWISSMQMPPPAELAQHVAVEMRELAISALAAPPRNCDIYGWRDAWKKWRTENHPQKPVNYKDVYDSTAAFMDWFMGTADKGGAA